MRWHRSAWALVAVAVLVLAPHCGSVQEEDGWTGLVVRVGGLATSENVVSFELAPGDYSVEASGICDASEATIDISVLDAGSGLVITSTSLVLTLAEAGAQPGDTGSAEAVPVTLAAGQHVDVVLEFVWEGGTPAADINIDMTFVRAPDIQWAAIEPSPPLTAGDVAYFEVGATSYESPFVMLDCTIDLFDSGGGMMGTVAMLNNAPIETFTGSYLMTPADLYTARVALSDLDTGAVTLYSFTILVE